MTRLKIRLNNIEYIFVQGFLTKNQGNHFKIYIKYPAISFPAFCLYIENPEKLLSWYLSVIRAGSVLTETSFREMAV